MHGYFRDNEQRLNSENKCFETIFYESKSPLVIFKGPTFILETYNEKFQQIYHNRELLGKPLLEALPEFKGALISSILTKVYETGEYSFSCEGLSPIYNSTSGQLEERYFDTVFSRISFGADEPFRIIATPREVTDRVVEREKMKEYLFELEQQIVLREKFVSSLTHDLRTPLTIAKVGAQVLKHKANDPQIVKDMAERIVANVDRSVRMIHNLLDVNVIKFGNELNISTEECRLELIISEAVNGLEALYGKRFEIQNDPGEIVGYWDASGIHRLIENLATNAIKYGDPETNVTITLERDNDWVEIKVHNLGHPISQEEQVYLFNHYCRSKSALDGGQVGWGIGLALVKSLVEAHKGVVRVESTSDHGTTFFIKLPLDVRKSFH